jgi:hypothetical protein
MENIQELMKWFKAFGFELVLFIAGLAGAYVNLTNRKNLTTIEQVTAVICGGLIANYLTPIFVNLLAFSESVSYGIAFILGYMGLKSVELFINWLHNKFKEKKI